MLPTLLLSLAGVTTATWTLQDDYVSGGNFFSKFQFFTSSDPTHGFVQYQSQSNAQNLGLISQSSSNVYIGTDHSNKQPNGRPSVRIQSYNTYNSGLFLLDLQHMPGELMNSRPRCKCCLIHMSGGICGTWPAFWLLGDDWPSRGEIDIIEVRGIAHTWDIPADRCRASTMATPTRKLCTLPRDVLFRMPQ